MISPYGANEVDNLESPYRRNPTGMDPVNPFYDNMYTERKDLYQNLNAKLYAEVKLPFGIEYTLNLLLTIVGMIIIIIIHLKEKNGKL